MSEMEILHAIMVALSAAHDVALWRNHTGQVEIVDENGVRPQRFGVGGKGGADILGIVRVEPRCEICETAREYCRPDLIGRFFALEVKTPTGWIRPEQIQFLNLVRGLGGFGAVVRSVDEALAALDRARNGASE